MNDQPQLNQQSQIMNQHSKLAVMNPQQPPMMNPQPPPMMNQSQILTQSQPPLPPMLNRNYKTWPQQFPSDPNNNKFHSSSNPNFVNPKQSMLGRSNWKNKKGIDKHKNPRRMENPIPNTALSVPTSSGGYKPPTLNELQFQNRLKARKFYPKKKFNNRFAPYAPRNTTSFIIRAKKAGGIASLVSPCPVTPAVLPTPIFSPSREVLGDMAKEEWGVDGYGSMKGLIRLRSGHDEDDEEEGGGSSESDVEEHVEVERRLDHDLSRFEMIYPNYGVDYNNVLENRVDDQDSHISQLEEENLTLKERLFLMESELQDLRRRLQCLERQKNHFGEDVNEEVVENVSENENDSDGESDVGAATGVENVSGNVVTNFEANPNEEIFNELSEINGLKIENKEAFVSNAKEGDSKDEADGCGI